MRASLHDGVRKSIIERFDLTGSKDSIASTWNIGHLPKKLSGDARTTNLHLMERRPLSSGGVFLSIEATT